MESNDSRDEQGRQTFPDRDTAGRAKVVKPPGFDQRAEPSPASFEEMARATDEAGIWERVFQRDNLLRALARVERNGGAPGIDGMTHLRQFHGDFARIFKGLWALEGTNGTTSRMNPVAGRARAAEAPRLGTLCNNPPPSPYG